MKRIYEFTVNKEEEVSEDTVETKKRRYRSNDLEKG